MDRRRFIRSSLSAAIAASLPGTHALAQSLVHTPTTVPADIDALTGDGAEVTLAQAAVQELSDSLKGKLILPGSESYDDARWVLQPLYDKYPALIVQPTGAADVQNAVTFARENNLLLAVKCGGHSAAGKSSCDKGMQIDLSQLRNARSIAQPKPPASPAAACWANSTMKQWHMAWLQPQVRCLIPASVA